MKLKFSLFLLFSSLVTHFCFAQLAIIPNYFANPVNTPLLLSGNFAELRSNHFHAGLDFKTNQVEGKPVYSAADGYISKIKISPWAYGKMICVTHPNGFVTLYAHLQKFNDVIERYACEAQYANKDYCIDIDFTPEKFPVKKGEFIAFSGNTGGSAGPHLHFEIKDTAGMLYNPLLFNFPVKDNLPPILTRLFVYPLSKCSSVDSAFARKTYKINGRKGSYSIDSTTIIKVNGEIGFGLDVEDILNNSNNKCGIYSLELLVDSVRYFYQKIDMYLFSQTRAINSHMDYEENYKKGDKFQKCFVAPNNQLPFYKDLKNRGIINITDDKLHSVSFIVKDVYGNASTFNFSITGTSKVICDSSKQAKITKVMPYQQDNIFTDKGLSVFIPQNALYDTLFFRYSRQAKVKKCYSDTYIIHSQLTPLHLKYKLSIKPDSTLADSLKDKALIVQVAGKGSISSLGGRWLNDSVSVQTYLFGRFAVAIDTTVPDIRPIKIKEGHKYEKGQALKFKVYDNLSGVNSFAGYIDGVWVMFEYNTQKNWYIYHIDDKVIRSVNPHTLLFEAIDIKGNKASFSTTFLY